MCCKVQAIPELNKPRDRWCTHCDIGNGCKIYADRPQTCSDFFCIYLLDAAVGEHWRPSHARMVMSSDAQGMYVHVDPARADAWRKEPYYSDLKNWSANFAKRKIMTIVCVGDNLTAVLPDRDKPLGRQDLSSALRLTTRMGARGIEYDVEVYDPQAAGVAVR